MRPRPFGLHLTVSIRGFSVIIQYGNILSTPGGEIAPRTAIGVDAQGRLLIFEADGIEDLDYGLTMYQLGAALPSYPRRVFSDVFSPVDGAARRLPRP